MKYDELDLIISSTVYEPAEDSFLLAKHARTLKGRVLEVGCGSGIASLHNAKNNPKNEVIGIDRNPDAVKCSKENAKRNGITNAHFIVSNLFSKIPKTARFDAILFNPPYLPTDQSTRLKTQDSRLNMALDGGKSGRIVLDRFLAQFDRYLRPNGTLLLIHSSLNDLDKTLAILKKKGFKTEILDEQAFFFERLYLLKAVK